MGFLAIEPQRRCCFEQGSCFPRRTICFQESQSVETLVEESPISGTQA